MKRGALALHLGMARANVVHEVIINAFFRGVLFFVKAKSIKDLG
jgi:hypothetical protein